MYIRNKLSVILSDVNMFVYKCNVLDFIVIELVLLVVFLMIWDMIIFMIVLKSIIIILSVGKWILWGFISLLIDFIII